MTKIDKLLADARQRAQGRQERELREAVGRMTTAQLYELLDESLTDSRMEQIFSSVGAVHLIRGETICQGGEP